MLNMYFCEIATKCLFCKKRCEQASVENVGGDGTQLGASSEDPGTLPTVPTAKDDLLQTEKDAEGQQSEVVSTEVPKQQKSKKDSDESCCCKNSAGRLLGSSLDKWDNEEAFHANLKYAFVLRELLGYPKRKCVKYMKEQHQLLQCLKENAEKEEGEVKNDGWFSVCKSCTKLVEEGHQIYHEIEQLSQRLDGLKNNLKELLISTQEEIQQADDEGDRSGDVNDENDEAEEEEEITIFAEVLEYFVPGKSPCAKSKEGRSIVKMEAETSSPFGDDDPLIDELLAAENFDDGSDWAPSDPDEIEGEEGIEEALDIKPNIDDINLDKDRIDVGENEGEGEESAEKIAGNDTTQLTDQIQKISSKILKDRQASKPGPKSRKMMISTRSSRRLKQETRSDDPSPWIDDEEVQVAENVEVNTMLDIVETELNSETDSPKKKSKTLKSILSDSESESMTESEPSDDSDYDDRSTQKFNCKICCASYFKKHRLKEHEKLHTTDDAFKCDECPFVSITSRGLQMHTTKIHQKKRKDRPVERMSSSSSAKKSKVYKPKPLKVGEFQCPFCPVTYQTAHRLKEHQEHHLNLTSDMIRCEQCNYICLFERGMKIHVTKYHSGPKGGDGEEESDDEQENNDSFGKEEQSAAEYTCKICDAVYKTPHRLREHKALHKNKNAVRCSECPFVCKTNKGFVMHMRAQHGVKPIKKDYRRRKGKPKTYSSEPQHCHLCPAKYYTNHRFRQHLSLHSSETQYPNCTECGWVFSSEDKRDYHMKLSHNMSDMKIKSVPKTYQCNHCDATPFGAQYKFKEHLLLNHKDKVFQCSICDQIYESQQLYDLHVQKCTKKEHHSGEDDDDDEDESGERKERSFSCTLCTAKFSKQDSLGRHFALKHSTEQFPCTLCSRVFPTESRLRYHMARQHDKIQNTCKICGYKAHGASHLRLHMQKHTKERLFACELCGKTFVSPTYLTAHRQMEHFKELGLDPIKCSQCELLFPNNSILKYHVQKVHEKKFKYFCEVCGKGFLFASGLKNHSAIHSTERTEVCQFCGASYVHNRVLMDHLKKHHPEEYAASKGLDPSTLKVPATASTQGPFLCKFCNMEFPSRWALHNHLKSHTEVYDRYKCTICGKGYSSPAGVKRHEETAHVTVTHSCQFCGKTFPCKDYLRYHIKNHCHKKDDTTDMEPAPSTSKRPRNQEKDIKHDPHIVKEAGLLHIVTPGSSATVLSSAANALHHLQGHSQNQHLSFPHSQVQPGSGASSSSSYAGAPPLQQNPHHQQQNAGSEDAGLNSFYRSYFSQQGFPNK